MIQGATSLIKLQNHLILAILLAFVLLLWLWMASIADTVKGNWASLLLVQSLERDAVDSDATRFLVGDFAVNDPIAMNEAVTLWESTASRNQSYLYALALYALGKYDDVLRILSVSSATRNHPLEGMVWGHTHYALDERGRAGEMWRAIGFDFPMRLEANRAFNALQFENALLLYQRLEAMWPQDHEIQIKLGDVYRSKSTPDSQQAVFHYQRAAALGHDQDRVKLLILITELATTGNSGAVYAQLETMLARSDLSNENRVDALRVMHNLFRYYFADPLRAASYLEMAAELPRTEGDIWEELQLTQMSLDRGDCESAQIWINRADERFIDKMSPLSLFRQLQQDIAKECG